MSVISFIMGVVVGGAAMKLYIDKQGEETKPVEEPFVREYEEKVEAPEVVEFTSDGIIEIEPSDEEIIKTAITTLKRSKSRISIASVSRESGLSTYKVGKYKKLIEKAKK